MKKLTKSNNPTKIALFAGATALISLTHQAQAQSSDALLDKLVDKGILTTKEAQELREESDKGFTTAFQAKTGMPDWVTSYKFYGDLRGRYDQMNATDNSHFAERTRFRYRLRAGVIVNMLDNLEAGFSLTSGDNAQGNTGQGNPLSGNSTMGNNGSKKGIWVDTAYGKWTALNSGDWFLAGTVGKMNNPFNYTPMIFDADYTPEGAAMTGSFTFLDEANAKQSLAFTGAAFILDEVSGNTQDPYMFGEQVVLNSKWTEKLASSVGLGLMQIVNVQQLTAANVPYQNQGNTIYTGAPYTGAPVNNFTPLIADASVTYTLDSFPLYNGAFPIKPSAEFIHNTIGGNKNNGFWAGITIGKSGHKNTWDLSYRYEYLEADAWYAQVVDDDTVVYYQNTPTGSPVGAGAYAGTNIKGHMVKFNYSITDSLTFSLTGFLTQLIDNPIANNIQEPNSQMTHVMADLSWKF